MMNMITDSGLLANRHASIMPEQSPARALFSGICGMRERVEYLLKCRPYSRSIATYILQLVLMVQLLENVTVLCVYNKAFQLDKAMELLVDIHMQLIDKYQANEEWPKINIS